MVSCNPIYVRQFFRSGRDHAEVRYNFEFISRTAYLTPRVYAVTRNNRWIASYLSFCSLECWASVLASKSANVEERTSNESGYQQGPELPHCGSRTVFVNPGFQDAVRKLRQGRGG